MTKKEFLNKLIEELKNIPDDTNIYRSGEDFVHDGLADIDISVACFDNQKQFCCISYDKKVTGKLDKNDIVILYI